MRDGIIRTLRGYKHAQSLLWMCSKMNFVATKAIIVLYPYFNFDYDFVETVLSYGKRSSKSSSSCNSSSSSSSKNNNNILANDSMFNGESK